MRLCTSSISGTFSIVTSSVVSRLAQMTCNASFLAPIGVMEPDSVWPPSMMNLLMESDDGIFLLLRGLINVFHFRYKGYAESFVHFCANHFLQIHHIVGGSIPGYVDKH